MLAPWTALVAFAFAQEAVVPVAVPSAVAAPEVSATRVVDRVVAVVNDEVVLLSEVYEYSDYLDEAVAEGGEGARLGAEEEVVELLIERILVLETVEQLSLEATDTQVDRAIDDVARRNGLDREQLRAEVERSGMPWEAYRAELRAQLGENNFQMAVIRPRVNLSEDELRDAYRRLTVDAPASADVLALFLATPDPAGRDAALAQAEALRARVLAGEDFAALSREYDQGPFGEKGGEMGRFAPGDLAGPLDAAVQATPTGGVSTPVATDRGVFLFKVAQRVASGSSFEDVRARLEMQVAESRMAEEQQRWFQQARRQAAVRVMLQP